PDSVGAGVVPGRDSACSGAGAYGRNSCSAEPNSGVCRVDERDGICGGGQRISDSSKPETARGRASGATVCGERLSWPEPPKNAAIGGPTEEGRGWDEA